MKRLLFLACYLAATISALAQTSTLPSSLGTFTVFRESPVPVTIVMPSGYPIATPVVELWNNGEKLSDSTVVVVSGDTLKFTFTPEQLVPLVRDAYMFVKLDGEYTLGAIIKPTISVGVPSAQNRTISLPASLGIVRVSVIGDAATAMQAASSATIQANKAKAYHDSTKVLLDSSGAVISDLRGDIDSVGRSPYYRVIYEKGAWPTTSEFTILGTHTPIIASNNIRFSGSGGVITNTIGLPTPSGLDNWRQTILIKTGSVTSTTWGVGLGKRASGGYGPVNTFVQIALTTGADNGRIFLYTGPASAVVASSASAATFSAGDTLELIVERVGYRVRAWARNKTVPGATATIDYLYSTAPGSTIWFDNSGRFSIFNIGGIEDIIYWKVTSTTPTNPNIAFVGDSKTQGGSVTAQNKRFSEILGKEYKNYIIMGMGSDRTIELQARLPEIIALRPKKVLLEIGSNDTRHGGESSAVYLARYASIVSSLEAAGIKVYHLLLWETALSLATLRNYVNTNYPTDRVIDLTNDMSTVGSSTLVADGVHPSDIGNALIAEKVLASGKLANDNRSYVSDSPREEGVAVKSGTGSTTSFTISHGLGKAPTSYGVTAASAAAKGWDYVTVDDTKMTVYYTTAPPSGTDNVLLSYYMKL